ncbi:MAG: SURF1 family protein [Nostocoides sp.]
MLRLLFTRRWLGALALAAILSVVFYQLGWWQWHRYEAKAHRNDLLEQHYAAAPVPLDSVVPPDGLLSPADQWTRVTLTGSYAPKAALFVRNRVVDHVVGYEVLNAFVTDEGRTITVDRGFAPLSAKGAATLPEVPSVPVGPVTVVGWLRPGEPSLGRSMPTGQVASINLSEAGRQWDVALVPAYVIAQQETMPDGSQPARPAPLPAPDRDLGPHQAYAYQWWFFILVAFWLVWFGVRHEYLTAHPELARPKKPRIWDEEDE